METTKKSSEFEPTLLDVLEAVQGGFAKVDKKFEKVDQQFRELTEELGGRMTAIERRVGAIEVTLEGMRETLESIEHAVDKDAEVVVNHESRISHIEKLNGIVSVPVKHLAGLEASA